MSEKVRIVGVDMVDGDCVVLELSDGRTVMYALADILKLEPLASIGNDQGSPG